MVSIDRAEAMGPREHITLDPWIFILALDSSLTLLLLLSFFSPVHCPALCSVLCTVFPFTLQSKDSELIFLSASSALHNSTSCHHKCRHQSAFPHRSATYNKTLLTSTFTQTLLFLHFEPEKTPNIYGKLALTLTQSRNAGKAPVPGEQDT